MQDAKKIRPNFVVIGAPKSGTTSLYYYLKQHPDVFLPTQKELHYFSYEKLKANTNGPGDELTLSKLCSSELHYLAHFKAVANQKAIGDISPSYLYYATQNQIKATLGDVKIIAMLRNPIDKAYSQYMHMIRDQYETLSFYEALLQEQERRVQGWSDIWRYAESSLYADKLADFMLCFGAENVHIILFDDFIAEPQKVMKATMVFLGIDACMPINTQEIYNRTGDVRSKVIARFLSRSNIFKELIKKCTPDAWRIRMRLKIMDANTSSKPAMDLSARSYLHKYFKDDVAKLEGMLGRKLNWLDDEIVRAMSC